MNKSWGQRRTCEDADSAECHHENTPEPLGGIGLDVELVHGLRQAQCGATRTLRATDSRRGQDSNSGGREGLPATVARSPWPRARSDLRSPAPSMPTCRTGSRQRWRAQLPRIGMPRFPSLQHPRNASEWPTIRCTKGYYAPKIGRSCTQQKQPKSQPLTQYREQLGHLQKP